MSPLYKAAYRLCGDIIARWTGATALPTAVDMLS